MKQIEGGAAADAFVSADLPRVIGSAPSPAIFCPSADSSLVCSVSVANCFLACAVHSSIMSVAALHGVSKKFRYPRKRTLLSATGMSVKCQNRKSADFTGSFEKCKAPRQAGISGKV
jgi:hypothetical protein